MPTLGEEMRDAWRHNTPIGYLSPRCRWAFVAVWLSALMLMGLLCLVVTL